MFRARKNRSTPGDIPSEPWLLLDPPSTEGFARRGLREKSLAVPAPFPSIDLILLSGAVGESGYRPVYLDAQIRRWTWQRLYQEAPAIGAKGILSLLSSGHMNEELHRLGTLKQIMGGVPIYVVASIPLAKDPQSCLAVLSTHPWLNGIVLNTAENNFGKFIASPDVEPHNIAVRLGDEIRTPAVKVSKGEDLRTPRPVHAIFKDRRYFFPQTKRAPVTCVQMCFGCPYQCEFCLDNALYPQMRCRNVDDVVEEMAEIDQLGFREVYFKDLTFGLNKRVSTEFLEKLASRRLRLRWQCTTRVDCATRGLLKLMKKAGCFSIEFGVESGLRHRRAANGKTISDEQIRTTFEDCRRLGIETTAFVMMGFEDETETEIRTTIRFIESLRPNYVSYNIVTALPGTPLETRARKEGFLLAGPADVSFANSNIKHKYLTPEQLRALHAEAIRSFYCRPSTALMRLLRLRSVFELRKLLRLARFTTMGLTARYAEVRTAASSRSRQVLGDRGHDKQPFARLRRTQGRQLHAARAMLDQGKMAKD